MTQSGKSVFLSALIVDLMLTNRPDRLQIILVDPKMVEMIGFADAPHVRPPAFLTDLLDAENPVVTEADSAIALLARLTTEMDARYRQLANARVKKIDDFNAAIIERGHAPMPRVVMVFDEFADWMQQKEFAKEVDVQFQRLAGKARAAGIHLVVATQRPDNTVVSPILRANLGGKIAFRVDKKANSEIILDEPGAETLLGKGHGLTRIAGSGQAVAFQSPYIHDRLLEQIVAGLQAIYPAGGAT